MRAISETSRDALKTGGGFAIITMYAALARAGIWQEKEVFACDGTGPAEGGKKR
jgi:hypothetical protein